MITLTHTVVIHHETLGRWFAKEVIGDEEAVNACTGPVDDPSLRLLACFRLAWNGEPFHAEAIRVTTNATGEQVPDFREGCNYDGFDDILDKWHGLDMGYWHPISFYPFEDDTDTTIDDGILIRPYVI